MATSRPELVGGMGGVQYDVWLMISWRCDRYAERNQGLKRARLSAERDKIQAGKRIQVVDIACRTFFISLERAEAFPIFLASVAKL